MAEFFNELGVSHLERKEEERSMVYEIGRFCYFFFFFFFFFDR